MSLFHEQKDVGIKRCFEICKGCSHFHVFPSGLPEPSYACELRVGWYDKKDWSAFVIPSDCCMLLEYTVMKQKTTKR